MSQQKPTGAAAARPRQVTTAVVMAVVGAAVLVMSLFETLGRLDSPESRQTIDEVLGPAGDGLGITAGQVIDTLRALVFVSGALAAATVVFAVFVAQRHRGARIGLTVSAALLLFTLPVAGLMPLLVAIAAVLVWSRPARDWYAGRAPAAAPPVARALSEQGPSDSRELPGQGLSGEGPPPAPYPFGTPGSYGRPSDTQPEAGAQPGAEHPPGQPAGPYAPQQQPQYGQPPGGPQSGQPQSGQPQYGQPQYGQPQYGQPQYGQPQYAQQYGYSYPGSWSGSRSPDRRPTTVTVAAVLTGLGAGAVLAAMVLLGAVLAGASGTFVREFDRAAVDANVSLSEDQILAIGWSLVAVFGAWSLISLLLAVFAFRRSNPARWALAASAGVAALVSLVMILSVISLVPFALAAVTTVLLFTGGANDWYARRPRWSGPAGYPGYPTGHPGAGYGPGAGADQPGGAAQPGPPEGRRNKPW